jgi:hypothetical protein
MRRSPDSGDEGVSKSVVYQPDDDGMDKRQKDEKQQAKDEREQLKKEREAQRKKVREDRIANNDKS